MIITEMIPYGKLKSKVLTDEDFAFSVYRGELRKLGLEKGSEISEEMLRGEILPLLMKRAKKRIVQLLKDKDYTEAELFKKLRSGFCPACVAEEAVQWAKGKRYVDDRRYTEQFVLCHSAGKSRKRILYDLMRRGISKEQAEQFMDENPPDEHAQILKELKKSCFLDKKGDPKERNRILSRLIRRGYAYSEIDCALRELETR